jgi:hypothetical protein
MSSDSPAAGAAWEDATFSYHFHVGDKCHNRPGGDKASVVDAIVYGLSELLTTHEEDACNANTDHGYCKPRLQAVGKRANEGRVSAPGLCRQWDIAYRWMGGKATERFATHPDDGRGRRKECPAARRAYDGVGGNANLTYLEELHIWVRTMPKSVGFMAYASEAG